MQVKHLFEYAIIRVVPRVEREEFLNVGVILYCRQQAFLQLRFLVQEQRLRCFSPVTDTDEVVTYLLAMERICNGGKDAGPIGELGPPERFRWLTATRSTVVQASRVHPGLCENAGEALLRLFERLVLV